MSLILGTPLSPTPVASFFHLKILTPKQNLQRLQVAPVNAEAGNTSENLLKEIRQIIYFLCMVFLFEIGSYFLMPVAVPQHIIIARSEYNST